MKGFKCSVCGTGKRVIYVPKTKKHYCTQCYEKNKKKNFKVE